MNKIKKKVLVSIISIILALIVCIGCIFLMRLSTIKKLDNVIGLFEENTDHSYDLMITKIKKVDGNKNLDSITEYMFYNQEVNSVVNMNTLKINEYDTTTSNVKLLKSTYINYNEKNGDKFNHVYFIDYEHEYDWAQNDYELTFNFEDIKNLVKEYTNNKNEYLCDFNYNIYRKVFSYVFVDNKNNKSIYINSKDKQLLIKEETAEEITTYLLNYGKNSVTAYDVSIPDVEFSKNNIENIKESEDLGEE